MRVVVACGLFLAIAFATSAYSQTQFGDPQGPRVLPSLNGPQNSPTFFFAEDEANAMELGKPASADDQASATSLLRQGEILFERKCTDCHDAEKSLAKKKDLQGWLATVKRMAAKEDADIPAEEHKPIAAYLASNPVAAKDSSAANEKSGKAKSSDAEKAKTSAADTAKNSALIQQGESSFQRNCTQCHDAEKSLAKKKNISAWMATIRRMAEKDDADIPAGEHTAIATYLASLNKGSGGSTNGDDTAVGDDGPTTTVFGTVSPLWRGGDSDIMNPGFFSDAWVGLAHSGSGPISARVVSCISCHNESDGGFLSRIELVEAVVRLDLRKLAQGDNEPAGDQRIKSTVEAGRIIVPFGAFSGQVNPGVYRTVSKPLIFNMGQRVFDTEIGDPVLPMPYADEGINWNTMVRFREDIDATFDLYAVNGLQGGNGGIDFDMSRDYVDNNKSPALGARATIGTKALRFGSSFASGRFNSDTGDPPFNRGMNYRLYGADVSYRYEDIFRAQFEYAQRDSDRTVDAPADRLFRESVGGYYMEGELLLSRLRKLSLLVRYDEQLRHGPFPPPEAAVIDTGAFGIRRFTYGLNWNMPGGSLLMINHERWQLTHALGHVDVLGVRWAASF